VWVPADLFIALHKNKTQTWVPELLMLVVLGTHRINIKEGKEFPEIYFRGIKVLLAFAS